jgi:hypothetical protein
LKVKFGISDFITRHSQITDGTQDGGMDAYHIDSDCKKIYMIQSKFRNTSDNFTGKSMQADDLINLSLAKLDAVNIANFLI